jgi:hypothetical protein
MQGSTVIVLVGLLVLCGLCAATHGPDSSSPDPIWQCARQIAHDRYGVWVSKDAPAVRVVAGAFPCGRVPDALGCFDNRRSPQITVADTFDVDVSRLHEYLHKITYDLGLNEHGWVDESF